jgi:hypothetical protein
MRSSLFAHESSTRTRAASTFLPPVARSRHPHRASIRRWGGPYACVVGRICLPLSAVRSFRCSQWVSSLTVVPCRNEWLVVDLRAASHRRARRDEHGREVVRTAGLQVLVVSTAPAELLGRLSQSSSDRLSPCRGAAVDLPTSSRLWRTGVPCTDRDLLRCCSSQAPFRPWPTSIPFSTAKRAWCCWRRKDRTSGRCSCTRAAARIRAASATRAAARRASSTSSERASSPSPESRTPAASASRFRAPADAARLRTSRHRPTRQRCGRRSRGMSRRSCASARASSAWRPAAALRALSEETGP